MVKAVAPSQLDNVAEHNPGQWTNDEIALLGTASDTNLAERLKISRTTVTMMRLKLGIERHRYDRRHKWTDSELALLGTMYDREIAAMLNISSAQVQKKRVELNIDSF